MGGNYSLFTSSDHFSSCQEPNLLNGDFLHSLLRRTPFGQAAKFLPLVARSNMANQKLFGLFKRQLGLRAPILDWSCLTCPKRIYSKRFVSFAWRNCIYGQKPTVLFTRRNEKVCRLPDGIVSFAPRHLSHLPNRVVRIARNTVKSSYTVSILKHTFSLILFLRANGTNDTVCFGQMRQSLRAIDTIPSGKWYNSTGLTPSLFFYFLSFMLWVIIREHKKPEINYFGLCFL